MGLLTFFKKPPPTAPAPPPEKHYGLYSMSPGDVIISKPLYDVVLQHLRTGTLEARLHLAQQLEELTKGMY